MDKCNDPVNKIINKVWLNNDIFILLKKGHTLLHQACIVNNLEGAKKLMIAGADPCKKDWKGLDSICYAIQNRNPELIQTLLYLHKGKIHLNEQFTAK
jgi:ankyrin repeat protein